MTTLTSRTPVATSAAPFWCHRLRRARALVTGLMTLLLCACASKPYHLDYRPDTRFEDLRSYTLEAPSGVQGGDGLNDQRGREAVPAVLDARGFELVQDVDRADFLVTWRFVEFAELHREGASFGVGYGFGLGSRTGVGLSMGTQPPVQETLRYKLVLDLLRPGDRQVLWTAEARDPLSQRADPGEREAEIRALVAAMLEDLPPRP